MKDMAKTVVDKVGDFAMSKPVLGFLLAFFAIIEIAEYYQDDKISAILLACVERSG